MTGESADGILGLGREGKPHKPFDRSPRSTPNEQMKRKEQDARRVVAA